jgi:fumarate reductase flavoprotein subunit
MRTRELPLFLPLERSGNDLVSLPVELGPREEMREAEVPYKADAEKGRRMSHDIDRRDFLKGVAAGTAGVAVTGLATGLVGCTSSKTDDGGASVTYPEGFTAEDYANSSVILEEIKEFVEEKTYDIVVVGAGTSGLPAVLTALDEGVTVACLQREPEALAQGNGASGVILEESTELGVLRWMQGYREAASFRINWDLTEFFARHSGETLAWMDLVSEAAGYPAATHTPATMKLADDSYVTTAAHSYGIKPESCKQLVLALATYAEGLGAEFFYSTPAVQLFKDGDRVAGVVGKNAEGKYIKFNATKGVILATGDYQNNDSLVERYSPDLAPFARKQFNKTGDGILMSAAVGGHMAPVPHSKQMHDMDAAPMTFTSRPFLAVNMNGERFMNEEIPMYNWNLALRDQPGDDPGRFCRIFDNDFPVAVAAWGGPPATIEGMLKYIPGEVENPQGVKPELIDTHRCDTLDELAAELGIPADALKASVERYNEMCEAGLDEDFGKQRKYLVPIKTAPFWGIRQWVRITSTGCGVLVDGNYQVVDGEQKPIPGLYAVGWGAGDLCGAIDWPLYQGGMSIGSCMTSGRYSHDPRHQGNLGADQAREVGRRQSALWQVG